MAVENVKGAETLRENSNVTNIKDVTRSMNSESNDVDDSNVDNPTNTEQRVKVVGESSRPLSFRERMKNLSPHCLPLKERMRDKTVCTLMCFDRVHLHQEWMTKNSPGHVGSRKHCAFPQPLINALIRLALGLFSSFLQLQCLPYGIFVSNLYVCHIQPKPIICVPSIRYSIIENSPALPPYNHIPSWSMFMFQMFRGLYNHFYYFLTTRLVSAC